MSEISEILSEQKKNGEETEFYPTTKEIVKCIADFINTSKGLNSISSILDIGCGNGCFFEKLDEINEFKNTDWINHERNPHENYHLLKNYRKYGIEKSDIIVKKLREDIMLIGSDFEQQTLIDKEVDLIFSNPPYSKFEEWTEKIIREAYSEYIVLVIPERWKNSEKIKTALRKRNFSAQVIGNYNFENAERKARAKVDVIFIKAKSVEGLNNKNYEEKVKNPFDLWFEETFSFKAEEKNIENYNETEQKKEIIRRTVLSDGDTAETLVKLYNEDMKKLYDNYKSLEKLDPALFKELKIDIKMLKENLKEKLKGLKYLYWHELFDKYDKVIKRLTRKEINKITSTLHQNTVIDFTLDNIYMITLWVLKNSNKVFDEQLKEFFYCLCNTESIQRYKSNKRWNEDDWQYIKKNITKEHWYSHYIDKEELKKVKNIQLDYRIVSEGNSNFEKHYNGTISFCPDAAAFLHDMKVIAYNLGFEIELKEFYGQYGEYINDTEWRNKNIYTKDGKLFCNIKLYQNGNRHIKFDVQFMKALNLEMARINKWILNKEEAEKELELSKEEVNKFWNTNISYQIENTSKNLLGITYSA